MATPLFLRTSLIPTFYFTAKTFSPTLYSTMTHSFNLKASMVEGSEITEKEEVGLSGKTKIFVAGATGNTGKRVVDQLLAKGFAIKAGVRDIDKAKSVFPGNNPDLQIVKADVTYGSSKLAEAIGEDSDAVICATGFQPS